MVKPTIVVEKVAGNPSLAVSRLFESFPDLPRHIGACKKVFIKINAVYFHPSCVWALCHKGSRSWAETSLRRRSGFHA